MSSDAKQNKKESFQVAASYSPVLLSDLQTLLLLLLPFSFSSFSFFFSFPFLSFPKMSRSKVQQLWDACTNGDLDLVKSLASDPDLNVNWIGPEKGDTPLHRACRFGHVEVVKVLLKHPKVNVNAGNAKKGTPFYMACSYGYKEVVSLLLANMRIDVNTPENDQCTSLWFASQEGHLPVVQLILASGREVDTQTKSIADWNHKTDAEVARYQGTRDIYDDESDGTIRTQSKMAN